MNNLVMCIQLSNWMRWTGCR